MADVRIPVAETADELLQAIEFAKNNQGEFDKLFDYLEKQDR